MIFKIFNHYIISLWFYELISLRKNVREYLFLLSERVEF